MARIASRLRVPKGTKDLALEWWAPNLLLLFFAVAGANVLPQSVMVLASGGAAVVLQRHQIRRLYVVSDKLDYVSAYGIREGFVPGAAFEFGVLQKNDARLEVVSAH